VPPSPRSAYRCRRSGPRTRSCWKFRPSTEEEAFAADGWDNQPFLEPVEANATFAYPASPNAADLTAIMTPAMESVMAFETEPQDLVKANNDVNQILSAGS
jgi:multiple sugar transport system substrate-binding protein